MPSRRSPRAALVRAPEAREHHLRLVGRKADARVLHLDGRHDVAAANAHRDAPAFGRVAHGVRNEVGRCLADHVGVAEHRHAPFHLIGEREVRIGDERLVRCHDALDELSHVHDFALHGRRAVLEARQLQNGVDEAAQALHLGIHRFQTLFVGFEHAVHHGLHRGLDGHERRAQLVRHVGGQAPFQLAIALDGVRHLSNVSPRRAISSSPCSFVRAARSPSLMARAVLVMRLMGLTSARRTGSRCTMPARWPAPWRTPWPGTSCRGTPRRSSAAALRTRAPTR